MKRNDYPGGDDASIGEFRALAKKVATELLEAARILRELRSRGEEIQELWSQSIAWEPWLAGVSLEAFMACTTEREMLEIVVNGMASDEKQ